MKSEKVQGIPLEQLFLDKGFKRNLDFMLKNPRGSETLLSAIKEELLRNAVANVKRKNIQSENAKKVRGRGDDGRTMHDLIAALARECRDEAPREIWPHLQNAIHDWADGCDSIETGGKLSYEYSSRSGESKSITYKHFSDVLRRARKGL
jgi:hypothetical protein